jgi:ATP-dependent DNA helicase RecQ
VDADLLERLKAWRTAEARRRGVPAYVVFADRVLAAIAAARPEGREALLGVKGVGPAKLESYAEAILALVTGGRPAHRS